jgi:hypothetical protein
MADAPLGCLCSDESGATGKGRVIWQECPGDEESRRKRERGKREVERKRGELKWATGEGRLGRLGLVPRLPTEIKSMHGRMWIRTCTTLSVAASCQSKWLTVFAF